MLVTKEERERRKKKPCCPKSCGPHMILLVILLAYIIIGALAFYGLENSNHLERAENITSIKKRVKDELRSHRGLALDEWNAKTEQTLMEYERKLEEAFQNGVKASLGYSWDFPSSFYFCLTVLTTIGYGNVVPATNGGKLLFIPYALIGIPISFLYLAKLGEVIAYPLRKIYKKATGMDKKKLCSSAKNNRSAVPSSPPKNRHASKQQSAAKSSPTNSDAPCAIGCSSNAQPNVSREGRNKTDGNKKKEKKKDVDVPIPLLITVLLAYLFLSALYFNKTHKTWTYIDSIYFCAVTYTTVGFGDLIPQFVNTEDKGGFSPLYLQLFILVGLILMSTCIHLTISRMITFYHFLFDNGNDVNHGSDEFELESGSSSRPEQHSVIYMDKSTAMTYDESLHAAAV